MTVIALDPGGTTGVAEYRGGMNGVKAFQMGGHEHHAALYEYLETNAPYLDVLVCEDFLYRHNKPGKRFSLEYIGVVKLFAQQHFDVELVLQPSPAKNFCDRTKLKTLGLYQPNQYNAMDALSHLVYFLVHTHPSPIGAYWLERLK